MVRGWLLQAKCVSNLIIDEVSSCHGNGKNIIFPHLEFNKASFYLKNSISGKHESQLFERKERILFGFKNSRLSQNVHIYLVLCLCTHTHTHTHTAL